VLSAKTPFEFKPLFAIVHANLRARDAASGGEEMLRLRTYEKLQTFVQAGYAKKVGKEYQGIPAGLKTYLATTAEANAAGAAGKAAAAKAAAAKPPVKRAKTAK